jgi:hypothetical protein
MESIPGLHRSLKIPPQVKNDPQTLKTIDKVNFWKCSMFSFEGCRLLL